MFPPGGSDARGSEPACAGLDGRSAGRVSRLAGRRPYGALMSAVTHYRSKTLATWITLIAGSLGLHRVYLYGWRDRWAWLYPWPTLAGLVGVQRMSEFGQDDRVAWALIPLLGVMLSATMLVAIVYGLTPDDKWHQRYNSRYAPRSSGWAAIIGVIVALLVGATVLMGTIAFSGQRFFELNLERRQNSNKLAP